MRCCLGLFSFLIMIFMVPQEVHADIIFINMNGSVTEIPAAQAAANQLGERLYVLPSQNTRSYKTEQLAHDLISLAKIGVRPRAMIVSGHHVKNQGYFGDNGEISLHRLAGLLPYDDTETLSQVKSFFASLQSLYLWGCYTGTLTNADRLVKGYNTTFPNTKFIIGFADKAPISTKAESGKTLKEMLLREGEFRRAPQEQLSGLVEKVSMSLDIILHRGNTFATKDGVSEVDHFIESCQNSESKKAILDSVLLVWKYYWNEIGPLPEDTGKGPLREAYRHLQRNNFCLQMGVVDLYQVAEIPALSTVIRLIYYKNIVKNFSRIYATPLATAKKELASFGLQDLEILTELDRADRGSALEKFSQLHKSLKTIFPLYKSDVEERTQYLYFNRMINDIEAVLYPSEDSVPQSWIEPGATEFSRFKVLNNFEKGKASARKKALQQLGG